MRKLSGETAKRLDWVWRPMATAMLLGFLGMAAVLFWSVEGKWELLRQNLLSFDYRFTLLCFGIIVVAWVCNGMRLKLLAKSLGYPLPLWRTTQVTLIGEFGVATTPAGSGMLVFRVFLMRRLGVPPGTTLSMIAMDGVMDSLFFLLVLPFAVWPVVSGHLKLQLNPSTLFLVGFAILLLTAAGYLGVRYGRKGFTTGTPFTKLPRWRQRFRAWRRLMTRRIAHNVAEFRQGFHNLLRLPKTTLLSVFLVVMLQWTCRYGVLVVLLHGFGYSVNPFVLFVLQGALFFFGLMVVAPGGSGAIEAAFAVVMASVIPQRLMGVVVILWRFYIYYLYVLVGGVLFATFPVTFKKVPSISKKEETSKEDESSRI